MTQAAIYQFAQRLATFEQRLNDRTPQLAHSTLEGTIVVTDEYDALKGAIGRQFDGSGGYAEFNGPPPLKPTPAELVGGAGGLSVRWDGMWADGITTPTPMNFTRLEVHISTDPLMTGDLASTLYGTIESPRGGELSFSLTTGTYYVRLVARNLSGARGPASDVVSAEVFAVVGEDAIQEIQDAVDTAVATANSAATQSAFDALVTDLDANYFTKTEVSTEYNETRSLVNGWRVTGKVTIDGGDIEADTIQAAAIKAGVIGAQHLVVGDLSNMSQLDETTPGTVSYGGYTTAIYESPSGRRWVYRNPATASPYFMFRNQRGPIPFKAGDRIRVTLDAFTLGASINVPPMSFWTYPPSGAPVINWSLTKISGPTQITSTTGAFVWEGDVPAAFEGSNSSSFLFGFGSALGSNDTRVRNVRAYIMNAGELVVDGGIIADKLAADSVTAVKIKAGEVTAGKLGALAVIAGTIAANAVTATTIAAGAIEAGKLAAGAVIAGNLAANAVTAGTIAAGAITADKLSATAIDGKTITGAVFQTAGSGRRLIIQPGGVDGASPGQIYWESGHGEFFPTNISTDNWGDALDSTQLFLQISSGHITNKSAALSLTSGSDAGGNKATAIVFADAFEFWPGNTGAGDPVLRANLTGVGFTPMASVRADGTGTFTSAGAGVSSAAANAAAVAFVAPPSGRVAVVAHALLRANALNTITYAGFEVRTGSSLRAGTVVQAIDILRSVANYNTGWTGGSVYEVVEGLTPGASYNAYNMTSSGAANCQFTSMAIQVIPLI